MTSFLILIVILALGYLSAEFIFKKLQSRFYAPSGIEYILLGILVGPSFANWISGLGWISFQPLISKDILRQINPGISAAIGVTGFVYGLNFRFADLRGSRPEYWRLTFFILLAAALILGGISYLIFSFSGLFDVSPGVALASSYALAIAGAVTSNFLIRSVISGNHAEGPVTDTLNKTSLLLISISILTFGLLFSIVHLGEKRGLNLSPTEWIVLSVLLSVFIGFLFFVFIARETDSNKLFVAVLGIVLFSAGAAYYLNFSPLFANFILGMVLTNLSRFSDKLRKSFETLLHPLGILIVIAAGFYWVPAPILTFIPAVLLYIGLRYLAIYWGGKIAYFTAYDKIHFAPAIGKGLLSSDIIVCAIVLDYIYVYNNTLTPVVISAILSSMIYFGITGFSETKKLLIDSGEIKGDLL